MREIRRKARREAKFRVDCIFKCFSSPLGDSCDALDFLIAADSLSPFQKSTMKIKVNILCFTGNFHDSKNINADFEIT